MRKIDLILPKIYESSNYQAYLRKNLDIEGEIHFGNNISDALEMANHSSRDVLVMMEKNLEHYDLKYFFEECKGSTSRAMTYEINIGQKLFWPSIGEKIHGSDYHDGFELRDIYYFCSNKKPFNANVNRLIPLPRNNKGFKDQKKTAALFLDRDGIINKDIGYLHKIQELKILEGIIPIIKRANEKKIPVIVLTNQSGVARAMFTEGEVELINEEIKKELKKHDAFLDGIYTSYYFESGSNLKYQKKSLLRKPYPGMLLLALYDFPIDIHRSFMLGDKISDRLSMPGLRSITLKGNYQIEPSENVFDSLSNVHDFLKKELY